LTDFPETQLQIAGMSMTMRNMRLADAAFDEAARMDPQLIDAWMTRAQIALALRDPERAIRILAKGIGENPTSAPLRRSRGAILADLGKLDGALADLREASRLRPDDTALETDIVFVLLRLNRDGEALDKLNTVRRRNADRPEFLDLSAILNQRLGRTKEAAASARELVERFPRYQRRPGLDRFLRSVK